MTDEQKQQKGVAAPPIGEAAFSLNWQVVDRDGCPVSVTMRAGVLGDWPEVVKARKAFMDMALGPAGYTLPGHGALPASVPAQQPPAGASGNGADGGDGHGTVVFQAEQIVKTIDENGQAAYKIKGGRFKKFGVRVWPEALPALGLDEAKLVPGPQQFMLRVVAVLGDDGQPKKVIGVAQ